MKYLLLATVLLTGCGSRLSCMGATVTTPPNQQPSAPCKVGTMAGHYNDALFPYLVRFSGDAQARDVPCYYTITVGVMDGKPGDLSDDAIGFCQPPLRLMVLKSFWSTASEMEKMSLMYHELGHCALGLDHEDDVPDIMNSYLIDEEVAVRQWDTLVNTLFERAKQ